MKVNKPAVALAMAGRFCIIHIFAFFDLVAGGFE
jgi:hypothetical protein